MEQLVQASATARTWIAGLEAQERAETTLQGLRVAYSAQGWAIVLPRNTPPRLIPARYREVAKLTGEWRFTTAELEEYDRILAAARVRLNALERTVFDRLVAQVAAAGERLRTTARVLAMLDVQAALADVAVRGKYVRPQLTTGTELHILGGRHPVVEQTLDEPFVPNTTTMASFRARVQQAGTDLDGDLTAISLLAQAWASQGSPSPAPYPTRSSALAWPRSTGAGSSARAITPS